MYQAQISSNLRDQSMLIEKEESLDDQSVDRVIARAQKCEETWQKMIQQLLKYLDNENESAFFLEITPAEEIVLAWRNVAIAHLKAGHDMDKVEKAVQSMKDATENFDRILLSLKERETPSALGLAGRDQYSSQFRHLLFNGHRVYSAFLVGIGDIAKEMKRQPDVAKTTASAWLTGHLLFVEGMVRKAGELSAAVDHDSNLSLERDNQHMKPGNLPHTVHHGGKDGKIIYEDIFSFDTSSKGLRLGFSPDWLLRNVVSYLTRIDTGKASKGDLVRLGLLVLDGLRALAASSQDDVRATFARTNSQPEPSEEKLTGLLHKWLPLSSNSFHHPGHGRKNDAPALRNDRPQHKRPPTRPLPRRSRSFRGHTSSRSKSVGKQMIKRSASALQQAAATAFGSRD